MSSLCIELRHVFKVIGVLDRSRQARILLVK